MEEGLICREALVVLVVGAVTEHQHPVALPLLLSATTEAVQPQEALPQVAVVAVALGL